MFASIIFLNQFPFRGQNQQGIRPYMELIYNDFVSYRMIHTD